MRRVLAVITFMDLILVLLIALVIDLLLGDPPTAFHPVGWMGKFISFMISIAPKGKSLQLIYGCFIVILGMIFAALPIYFFLDVFLHEESAALYWVIGGIILKSAFAVKGMGTSALGVRDRIAQRDLDSARGEAGMLVSRQTGELDESLVTAATVESVAESTSDSIVAPLFWFVVFGVPGALAYRMANTFDSMIGYRGEYEYLGKFAARLDDVLNFIPARITGFLLVAASVIGRKNAASAWRVMLRDHSKTASPNAGWPMSAAAGAMGIILEKVDHYKLGDPAAIAPDTSKITDVVQLMYLTTIIWVLIICLSLGVFHVLSS